MTPPAAKLRTPPVITVEGTGATSDGSVVTITSAGIYFISGSLDDGQIIVNTEDTEDVKLILNRLGVYSPPLAAG